MKNFLAIYTGSAEAMVAWNALSEAERQARTQQGIALSLIHISEPTRPY